MKPVVLLLASAASAAEAAAILNRVGQAFRAFASIDELLALVDHATPACVVADLTELGLTPAHLIQMLPDRKAGRWPLILLSEKTTVRSAVQLMRTGAHDLLEKPVSPERLMTSLASAAVKLGLHGGGRVGEGQSQAALTRRERQVAHYLVSGLATREVAETLGISVRTVEVYRGRIFRKLRVANVAALASLIAGLDRR